MDKILSIGWAELVVALLMGAPVRLRDGRTIQLYKLPEGEKRILDPSLFGIDVSKWQGNINFAQVAAYGTKFIILRCAYAITRDERFLSYINDCLTYFPNVTSVYHYYDPTISPTAQADKIIEILAPYKGKIRRVWGDFEFYWSGSYEASSHWKVYAERIIAAGYEFGVYTRKTWWDSRVGSLASWFGQFPLWAAQYSSSLTMIPLGWTKADIWQKGTPAIGAEVGTESLEVDYNIADDQFYESEYGEQVPPGGEVEHYLELDPIDNTSTMSIRADHPDSHIQGGRVGVIPAGTLGKATPGESYIYPTDKYVSGILQAKAGDIWHKAYYPLAGWVAEIHLGVRYMNVREIGAPTEPPPATLPDLPFRFEIGDDVLYVKQVIEGILKPK